MEDIYNIKESTFLKEQDFTTKQTSIDPETGKISWDVDYKTDFNRTYKEIDEAVKRLQDLVAQEKSILGSYMGSCVPVRDVPRFLNLYKQGRLPVDKLIDGKITFDNLNEGFDKLSKGKVIRQILMPNA